MSSIYDTDQIGIDRDSNVYCYECACKELQSGDDDFSMVNNWEGETMNCSVCNCKIYPTYLTDSQIEEIAREGE